MKRIAAALFSTPIVLLAGWALFLVYAAPGFLSIDSVDQLEQARAGVYGDWHPPFMAFLWRQLEHVASGPLPMLLLQSGAFLFGLAAILRRFISPRNAALAAVAILLFPPVLTTMGVIWKDSQMAGFLLAGTAALLSPSRKWRIAGGLFFFAASAVRYNAMAATLPLTVMLFVWRDGMRNWTRYGIAVAVWLSITIAAAMCNRALTDRQDHAWHGSVALFDIVGTFHFGPPLADQEVRTMLDGVPLAIDHDFYSVSRHIYNPAAHWWLSHDAHRMFDPPTTDAQRTAIAHAWRTVITAHPFAFLLHRWRVFREILGLSKAAPVASVWTVYAESNELRAAIAVPASYSRVQRVWVDALTAVQASWLFRAYLYFILAFPMLAFCRRAVVPAAILLSGMTYELSLFAAAPSSDFRYSHWMITCTIIATVAIFAIRRSTRQSPH